MQKVFLPCLFLIYSLNAIAQRTAIQYLSGTDKDHTKPWDFYCSEGRNSKKWTKIEVPSNWELQGFGEFNYGHDKIKSNEQGIYKCEFFTPCLKNEKTFIVFEGSMTDTRVLINGKSAGAIHQGGFYRFKYDITNLLSQTGRNMLEVIVDKTSADKSVNNAERNNSDFWVFGGIFRPVYLEKVPFTFIDRLAVQARDDGSFAMEVYAQNLKGDETIEAQVFNSAGEKVGKAFYVRANILADSQFISADFIRPKLWSAEFPNLYSVTVSIKNNRGLIHQTKQKFGFRTVELRTEDGLYVNGSKVILKGCNRHSFWPETGRTLSHRIQIMDVRLIKEMNMNAVRMSHYPPDADFLDVCDSLGLYVLDELTGWQAKYDTAVGRRLVKELVLRDVNHPSIIFWDNGNEGGWNRGLDSDFALYDPQKRVVIHPWEKFNGTDTKHYPDYNYILHVVDSGKEVFFPTEFLHGLYDGGAGAGLDDFWKTMRKYPHLGGGFIWAFLDECVLRSDKNGLYDGDGNHAPDGIVGPHREKEASFYTIKEIWSPVYIEPAPINSRFDGKIQIENRYSFTNLKQCTYRWKLVRFSSPSDKAISTTISTTGSGRMPDLRPGEKGILQIDLPFSWAQNDALYISAYSPDKTEIFTWSWAVRTPGNTSVKSVPSVSAKLRMDESNKSLVIYCGKISYAFDKKTGYLQKVANGSATISLSGGPALAWHPTALQNFNYLSKKDEIIVNAVYAGPDSLTVKWIFKPDQLVKLNYQYYPKGELDFAGLTFDYPEQKITGMKWVGRGPYRVWKNRLKGQRFGIWHKSYNNAVTGQNWNYPEFKGFHSEIHWVVFENSEHPFTVYTSDPDMYLQVGHRDLETDALPNGNVEPAFPAGTLGFLKTIPPMGTKFHKANELGPQGQKSHFSGEQISGSLWFDFNLLSQK